MLGGRFNPQSDNAEPVGTEARAPCSRLLFGECTG